MEHRWKPNVTVAAVIERDGRFLLVEEHTSDGLRLNNPAGHLDPGETLLDAVVRETLEETTHRFTPTALLGVYVSRSQRLGQDGRPDEDVTYLRFAYSGELGEVVEGCALDTGIVRTLWMTADEIRASVERHRSPLLLRCIEDHLLGQRYPLSAVFVDPSVTSSPAPG